MEDTKDNPFNDQQPKQANKVIQNTTPVFVQHGVALGKILST